MFCVSSKRNTQEKDNKEDLVFPNTEDKVSFSFSEHIFILHCSHLFTMYCYFAFGHSGHCLLDLRPPVPIALSFFNPIAGSLSLSNTLVLPIIEQGVSEVVLAYLLRCSEVLCLFLSFTYRSTNPIIGSHSHNLI